MKEIYLDTAATARHDDVNDIVINTMANAMRRYWQNPSSLYATDVKEEIDKCRASIAKFINAKSEEIYFTSGSSESNSWAIQGYANEVFSKTHNMLKVITTQTEHKSILKLLNDETLRVNNVFCCDVDKYGLVNFDLLKKILQIYQYKPILVSICMVNNEIGVVQNIRGIADLVHQYGGILHIDATQALGHIPIDVEELGIDMMSCSGHKICPCLRGIGFLYKRNGIDVKPLIYGTQEQGLRGGTENTYGIIGFAKALEYCDVSFDSTEKMIEKRDYFITRLETEFGCKLNGHYEYRLPNNVSVTFPQNITGESLLYMLEMSNIFISTGSACNSKEIKPSHVLKAIGLSDEEAMRTVRFSLPNDITYEEIDYVIDEIGKAIKIIEV